MKNSQRIGKFFKMLLLTACSIYFTSCPVMCWNCLVWSALSTSRVVYCFFFSLNFWIEECEPFTMMCALFLLFRRCLISWYNRLALVIFNVFCCGLWTTSSFPYWLLYVTRWCFYNNLSDGMLNIPFGLYQKWFWYTGKSPILFVDVTPALKCTCRYFLSGVSLVFGRYLPLMKAFTFNLLSRRHQLSSITDSDATSSMIYPTCIMLALILLCENDSWHLHLLDSIWNTTYDEVWQNRSSVDEISSHSLVGMVVMRLHDASSTFNNFVSPPPPSNFLFQYFPFFCFPGCFWIFFEIILGGSFDLSCIIAFSPQ